MLFLFFVDLFRTKWYNLARVYSQKIIVQINNTQNCIIDAADNFVVGGRESMVKIHRNSHYRN